MSIELKIVDFGSELYDKAVTLRYKVLRAPLKLEFNKEDLAKEGDDVHIVATKGKDVIGVLILTPIDEGVMKMRQVAVDPKQQSKGIGEHMVGFAEVVAKARGIKRLELNVRDVAYNFYKRLEYIKEGEPFEEVTIKHWFMYKNL